MKAKTLLVIGGAVGYVLGARDGRERYDQIKAQAQSLWNNPKVQETAAQAQDLARAKATEAADAARSKVTGEPASGVPGV